MEIVELRVGTWGVEEGYDVGSYSVVRCEAEQLGHWVKHLDERRSRGVTYTIYRTSEGTILVYVYEWSRWANEVDSAMIHEYATLEEAAEHYRQVLERAGVIPRRVMSLAEWRALRADAQE